MSAPALAEWSESLSQMERLSAFCIGSEGGNPAGVALLSAMPGADAMQKAAAEIGYSETVFLAPIAGGANGLDLSKGFFARYFAPEMEVPFCGHATIAAGAALGGRFGAGRYPLSIASGEISVEAWEEAGRWKATLSSPPSWWRPAQADLARGAMALFGLEDGDMAPDPAACEAGAGAAHLFLFLAERDRLTSLGAGRALCYDLDAGRRLMDASGIATIALVWREGARRFHIRNAFAAGGVAEDPATGAAAAALAGLLRAKGALAGDEKITLEQGRDMGAPSHIEVQASEQVGGALRVSGFVRKISA